MKYYRRMKKLAKANSSEEIVSSIFSLRYSVYNFIAFGVVECHCSSIVYLHYPLSTYSLLPFTSTLCSVRYSSLVISVVASLYFHILPPLFQFLFIGFLLFYNIHFLISLTYGDHCLILFPLSASVVGTVY